MLNIPATSTKMNEKNWFYEKKNAEITNARMDENSDQKTHSMDPITINELWNFLSKKKRINSNKHAKALINVQLCIICNMRLINQSFLLLLLLRHLFLFASLLTFSRLVLSIRLIRFLTFCQ